MDGSPREVFQLRDIHNGSFDLTKTGGDVLEEDCERVICGFSILVDYKEDFVSKLRGSKVWEDEGD